MIETVQLVAHVRWRWWFWPLMRLLMWIHMEPSETGLAWLVEHGMVVWVDGKATLSA
jgi:hypothetical protein